MRTFLLITLLIVLGFAGWFSWAALLPITPPQTTFVLLRSGWTARHIASELQHEGVIRSARAFLLVHYVEGPGSLKAGEYKFDGPANVVEVRRRILRGDVYVRTVTVPEGYNLYDIANAVEQAGLGPATDFVAAAKGDVFLIKDLDPSATSLEGYLFPDTYHFTRIDTPHDTVAAMVRRFRREAQKIGLPRHGDLHQIVTLASIIEKETAVPEERPLVASVYYNRLSRNMLLGADPSVVYAALLAGRYRGIIYQSDLLYDSPYNTYRYPGLPPGPIANPGEASLQAAMNPAQTDFFYFVSDNNGHHRFSRTAAEHERNVAAYRRAVSQTH